MSWPLVTVSPSRALISIIRPDAREITGTARETSAATVPVTFSSGAATCLPAVASGNCSGWSTLTRLASSSVSTLAGGGASSLGSAFTFSLHPARKRLRERARGKKEKKHRQECLWYKDLFI